MGADWTLEAVVTAGGTREPIDDVRVLANVSTGRFGAAIAAALADLGVGVTLIGSRELLDSGRVDPRARPLPFSSTQDLDAALSRRIAEGPPDLLFMAAAVSDYSPVPLEGKLRSDAEELVVRLRRNPKILATLRERCGDATFLVGFKLLSGASETELTRVAREQVLRDRLDLTVANDLRQIRGGIHPVWLVPPAGEPVALTGTKVEVARRLAEEVLARRGNR